jgi:hypothetical protein
MRSTVVTMVMASTLVAAVVGMSSSAQSQVIIVIGNGPAKPYYTQPYPYPHPYPYPRVVYGEPSYYPSYGFPAPGYGYYNAGYYNGYRPYRPYGYGWRW